MRSQVLRYIWDQNNVTYTPRVPLDPLHRYSFPRWTALERVGLGAVFANRSVQELCPQAPFTMLFFAVWTWWGIGAGRLSGEGICVGLFVYMGEERSLKKRPGTELFGFS